MDRHDHQHNHNRALLHRATITIVNKFMKSQLHDKGCSWNPAPTTPEPEAHNKTTRPDINNIRLYDERKMARILEAFDAIARELQAFTRNVLNEQFPRIVSLLDDIHPEGAHDAFNSIADELFAEDIGWSHIVTLLVFGQELAYNCVVNENEDMVDHIAKWMHAYINLKLSDWIQNQGGWESISSFAAERATLPDKDNNKSLRLFVGAAATVALLGITLLCSKLHY